MCYINTIEYYIALYKKEILSYAITWINFADTLLSKMSVTKDKYCVISRIQYN